MPDRHTTPDDERAVSDILGYVIIFSIVITSVFVVASGFGVLDDVRDAERVKNAERAFDVMAENMAAIYERDAPSRSTEIDLGDSEIFYGSNVSITISGDGTEFAAYQIRPVEMRVTSDQSLVYEGGAVFRQQRDSAFMTREPPFFISERRVHVPVVQTTAPALESAGSTTVLVRGESTRRAVLESDTEDSYDRVTIEISSPRFEAWEEYLEEEPATTCTTPATETVSCTVDDPEVVYVTHQQIELSLIL
jgi:hypothetical protein